MALDDQVEILYELFDPSLPRLAPGDDRSTKRALDMLLAARAKQGDCFAPGTLRILDVGCGNGAHTLVLARHIEGTITAVDNHPPYLDELARRAARCGVADRIRPLLKDMVDMELSEGSFELIWSEGALYNMGFGAGIGLCHSLLVPGGCLAASELCWLRPDAPAECRRFFADEYPAMERIEANVALIRDTGFRIVGHFALPESAWTESYYRPLSRRLATLQQKYESNARVLDLLDSIRTEIDVFGKYSAFYGYVFFMMIRDRS